jgi:hypothetical protein
MSSSNHDVNLILKARDEATAKLNRLSGTIKGLAIGVAGYFSAAAIGGFLKSSVHAFMEAESTTRRFGDALANLGAQAELPAMREFSEQLGVLSAKCEIDIQKVMGLGAAMGMSGDTLKAATVSAIGYSAAMGIDMETAMKAVGKAAQGNATVFAKMGVSIDKSKSAQEQFDQVLAKGASNFNIARGQADTFKGLLDQVANAWEDAQVNIGQYIAESSRLKGAFQVAIFGLAHIGDVAVTVWAKAKAAMISYYDEQIERANWDHPISRLIKKMATTLGTLMADVYLEYGAPGMGLAGTPGMFGGGTPITTEGRNRNKAGLFGVLGDAMKSYENAMGQPVPGGGGSPAAIATAQALMDALKDAWGKYQNGTFDFGNPNAGAKVIGGGKGNPFKERAGWSLFESRTAGGISNRESPESRKLDRMIDLLARIADKNTREERKQAYIRTGNMNIGLTNFR